jgi:hypothetical protein
LVPYNQHEESITLPAFSEKQGKEQQSSLSQCFSSPQRKSIVAASGHWAPQASVVEHEFGYVLQAVLPGVNPKEVRAELLLGGRLVISGIRHNYRNTDSGGGGAQPVLFSILPEAFGESGFIKMATDGNVLESGRFRLVWKLPRDTNLDSMRADFKVSLSGGELLPLSIKLFIFSIPTSSSHSMIHICTSLSLFPQDGCLLVTVMKRSVFSLF